MWKMLFERALAPALIIIGIIVIVFAVFQGIFYDRELSVLGETPRERSALGLEALGPPLMWFFTLLTELVGGFFLATIGMKIIKK